MARRPTFLPAILAALSCLLFVPAASAQAPLPQLPVPELGPAPDLRPVQGQTPTPPHLRDCQDAGVTRVQQADPKGVSPAAPNPLAGLRFFVDPTEPAFFSYSRYMRAGRTDAAGKMWRIAGQPRFRAFGRWTRPNMESKVRNHLQCVAALQPGTVPLMVVMRHQGKACNKRYTGGGVAEDARTRSWYNRFARAVGDARVILAFEPDSLGTIDCLAKRRRGARMKLLRYGVNVLSNLPNATIYLEAGASDWEPAKRTAWQLRSIGIRKVRGFLLNATHYDWTGRNIKHGLKISRMTGGKHFIISTAYNGRGPVHFNKRVGGRMRRINVWCHPLKRGLGPAPTTNTARPDKVDAYVWIGRPGYSGGSCNGGPLPIGKWWPERALMFAENATDWLGPPRGTKNGHFQRYSLRELGG